MRIKEWYGWHFPELARIVVDNIAYAWLVKTIGFHTNIAATDLSGILPENLVEEEISFSRKRKK